MADPVTGSLERWLSTRTPEQLAALVRTHWHRGPRSARGGPATLAQLARGLTRSAWVAAEMARLTVGAHQVLTVASVLDPVFTPSKAELVRSQPASGRQVAAVRLERDRLLAALGADLPGDRRDAASAVLDELAERVLMWPDSDGTLLLPQLVIDRVDETRHRFEQPELRRSLVAAYDEGVLAEIVETLGIGVTHHSRWGLAHAIASHLSDEDTVRGLVASLPDSTRQVLLAATETGMLATGAVTWDADGSGLVIDTLHDNQDHVRLCLHALVVPRFAGLAVVPHEVFGALTYGAYLPFVSAPSRLVKSSEVPADEASAIGERARADALVTMGRLLRTLDAEPVALLKAGGFPADGTRRLAASLGVSETEAMLWVALARDAGLIGRSRQGYADVVGPTRAGDRWSSSPPQERADHLLRTWWDMDDIATWRPVAEEQPTVYTHVPDADASLLRHAMLRALAMLPAGRGFPWVTGALPPGERPPRDRADEVYSLLVAASWFAPLTVSRSHDHERIWQTLYEAELLGVTALGCVTAAGRALLAASTVHKGPAEGEAALAVARRLLARATPPPTLFD